MAHTGLELAALTFINRVFFLCGNERLRIHHSMKVLLLPTAALFSLLIVAANADVTIVQKVDGPGQAGEMTMELKDSKARTNLSGQISTITDMESGDVITLMHAQKSFMKMSGATTKALMEQMKNMTKATGGPMAAKPQPTGKKEKINGYDTEEYASEFGMIKMNFWIAKDFPGSATVLAEMKKLQQGSPFGGKALIPGGDELPGMPVRTEIDANGQKTTTTLVSVKEGPIDAKDFEVPSDYKEMKMPAMPSMPPPPPQ